MYDTVQFRQDLSEFNITLSDIQVQQFISYYELLTEWNRFMNLTAITEYEEVLKKHFVDSLSLVKVCDLKKNISLIDVGTGAGFPGIPLKIAFPDLKVTLLDSLHKRVQFLNAVIEKLKLTDIDAIHGRAEDFAKPNALRERYDICVSRAVANMTILSEYCIPFVKRNGIFVSYKSEKIMEEKQQAEKAISILGGHVENQIEFTLPDSDIWRTLFIVRKIKETPKKYPRKAGLPAKNPLI